LLLDCLDWVFREHFDVVRTPSCLTSGGSQLDQIGRLIGECAFAIVILDGLRPNVVFEYGMIHGLKKPTILLKEIDAIVDLTTYLRQPAPGPAMIDLDNQFSDVKDQNYAQWNRYDLKLTLKTIWEQYQGKMKKQVGYVDIPKPRICL